MLQFVLNFRVVVVEYSASSKCFHPFELFEALISSSPETGTRPLDIKNVNLKQFVVVEH